MLIAWPGYSSGCGDHAVTRYLLVPCISCTMVRRGSDSDSSASSDDLGGRDPPEDDAATVAPPAQDDAAGPSSPDG